LRRTTLQPSQIRFTLARIFIVELYPAGCTLLAVYCWLYPASSILLAVFC
jgi:hypothetical protein